MILKKFIMESSNRPTYAAMWQRRSIIRYIIYYYTITQNCPIDNPVILGLTRCPLMLILGFLIIFCKATGVIHDAVTLFVSKGQSASNNYSHDQQYLRGDIIRSTHPFFYNIQRWLFRGIAGSLGFSGKSLASLSRF